MKKLFLILLERAIVTVLSELISQLIPAFDFRLLTLTSYPLPLMKMSAAIAPDGLYRYSLTRVWRDRLPCIGFIMLNPSTADATKDDPTIRRCINFAYNWGYGGIEVGNLFAYRATHQEVLRRIVDPVGRDNDRYLVQMQQGVDKIVVAWGNWGSWQQRDRAVLRLLTQNQILYCLGTTLQGQPRHPLYIRGNTALTPYQR